MPIREACRSHNSPLCNRLWGTLGASQGAQGWRIRLPMQETWGSLVRKIPWRRKWQPTPAFLPGKSHGQRSLVDCSPWGHKELDTTEQLSTGSPKLYLSSVLALTVRGRCPFPWA